MWHWDQGHLPYFQFDALRRIAAFVVENDFKVADRNALLRSTGLDFRGPASHSPWRQYARTLKQSLLISQQGDSAVPTAVAHLLAKPGTATCDEYLHFLATVFTDPSPALSGWDPSANFRHPLLFSIKYLLAKTAIDDPSITPLNEIIGAYEVGNFNGQENQESFLSLISQKEKFEARVRELQQVCGDLLRQARESLRVVAQISYLHMYNNSIIVSLDKDDALEIFEDLTPIEGLRSGDRESEIIRLANLFKDGSTSASYEYPRTVISDVLESGFQEGNKVKKMHVIIERNSGLRKAFFRSRPTAICDVCLMDTSQAYPWAERIIDLHHLLPLSSGTRVDVSGTMFDDLIPVCPSCHRAIHRFYDRWLSGQRRIDFQDSGEARSVYEEIKSKFNGGISTG